MTKSQQVIMYMGVAIMAVTAGLLLRAQLTSNPQSAENGGAETLFAASLPDLQGKNQSISQWRGNVMVINFWATWCEPCRDEIPEFIELQERFRAKGLVFIGIAVDQQERTAAFSKEIGINYPVLVGDMRALDLAGAAGNRQGALPFTVVIDRGGNIIGTKLGRLSHSKLESMIKPLL
ncbi:TlpA disulfide reductase family protein [Nitrosospira sp. Nsp13]|jgi:thiol-disulfide isomerase/thioredoxin|uniref:TlpA family protein disulfide reductase n=1 Tax=Nitrosospira sp. Nsp13 TaxID=1855332 RepID=UPI00087E56B1|nr:TlpA disulfide reductase family protein [Nitrosospira sp. Nsp13]SCY47233.1 Thiol-disulfide isomerase or thioredoxin [Nitrosospira sp. Nsp13]